MRKHINKIIWLLIIFSITIFSGCRSSFEKRVNKDIAGVNEQVYVPLPGKKINFKDKNEENSIHKEGYKYYLEQNYAKASERISELTGRFAESSLTDNALYWQAESLYKLNQINSNENKRNKEGQ